jgi:hypothetical protein
MDTIVHTLHPYAVIWGTTLCSACFARLAQDHVLAIGGVGFSDAFAQANAPYFWSPGESSTHIEEGFARFWCNQLSSKDSTRVVSFAQDKNPSQDFNGQKRVLGVISTNDPDNEDAVTNVLVPALNRDCGDGGSVSQHHYFYSQDISTASQQINAGISAMDTPSDPATDVVCLCDPVAPELLYSGEQNHNYYPENVLADAQGMGVDPVAQAFESTPQQLSLACPQPQAGCEFDTAFGIMSSAGLEPAAKQAGPIVYRLGGGTNLPAQAYVATGDWEVFNMLASLIENTGPDLTPARMAAAARLSTGFLYVVSRSGITGARGALDPGLSKTIRRARRAAGRLPLAVGFGIGTPAAAARAASLAEGIVVGSALVAAAEKAAAAGSSPEEAVERLAGSLARAAGRRNGAASSGRADENP